MKRFVPAAAVFAFIGAAQAADMSSMPLNEWKVPWENSRPRDPFAESESSVWFVGQRGNYIANLNPQTGAFKQYEIPDGALPHNVIVDEDGIVWYAGNGDAHIGRLDPATGAVERVEMPEMGARDPHTLVQDHDGDIWFTVQGGNYVGKLVRESRAVSLIPVPTEDARPYGIKIDSRNRPWVVEFGTNKLALVDTDAMTLTEYELPRDGARPRRIEITSDDKIWYVDYAEGYLGRFDPETEAFTEWASPGGEKAQPYGLARDALDRLWYVEFGTDPARFVGFDTHSEQFISLTDIPSGGGVRHMHVHEPTQTVWFGTDSGTIGKLTVQGADGS